MEVTPMQLGLVFWAEKEPAVHLEELKAFGLSAGQLGVPPSLDTTAALAGWKDALASGDVYFSSAVAAYAGEDYADLERVHQTVGFTAPGYAAERIERTRQVSDFAAQLGLKALSCHIGFIPEDASDPLYQKLIGIAQELCDICGVNGQNFVLETGQESAETLLRFLGDVQRPNIRVNFDPANMVLYGSGDPLEALALLQEHVLSVHCKDGRSPAGPGQLGNEVALGEGEVDFPGFLKLLKRINYTGLLTIEREEPDTAQRTADIKLAVQRLNDWKQAL
ncbi:sugar phosphate isomerase/epimerase family protein [Terriglobus albidus]|uniref:sugar phosphate isomerase/epimerase family protein n=1 Tax=Terriglobus albidus TaxID=1592106 RepID=UPI0021DFDB45|nr:sugar phosphate isomerase/epimerase family protein [Terriglobus albidus]